MKSMDYRYFRADEMATVEARLLDTIRALEEHRNQAELGAISPFQPGRSVRLRDCALQGLEGLVQSVSSKRVTLLLEILGRQKTLQVDHEFVELV